ncbi:hypothetical protein [Candidatus Babela massiliensis]|uniref:Uncharacterized protein n=1 Tax=Candidatus Babela massiliensis TaxID=673862 RepID=V6DJA2_9BACT|nr:hypothetical protein [Candidatus Babela massiliensis]CDK30591.1 hypothetical protein BABL1_gene_425 [Candidatus Babela massiliensis]
MKKILILSLMGLSLYAYSEDIKEEAKELHNTSTKDDKLELTELNELDKTDKDTGLEGEITVEETPFSKEVTKEVSSTKNLPDINQKIVIVEKEKEEIIPKQQNNKNIEEEKEEKSSIQPNLNQSNDKFEEDLENLENFNEEELQAFLERLEKELNFKDIE